MIIQHPTVYSVSCQIDDKDIDYNNHLTYDQYLKYFKKSWFNILTQAGINPLELPKENKGIVVTGLHLKYKNEVSRNKIITIDSFIMPLFQGYEFSINHTMKYNDIVAALCMDTNCFVDTSTGSKRMIPIPEEFLSKLEEMCTGGVDGWKDDN